MYQSQTVDSGVISLLACWSCWTELLEWSFKSFGPSMHMQISTDISVCETCDVCV